MDPLLSLIVAIVVIALAIWIVERIPLPAPWNTILTVLVGLVLLVWLLRRFPML